MRKTTLHLPQRTLMPAGLTLSSATRNLEVHFGQVTIMNRRILVKTAPTDPDYVMVSLGKQDRQVFLTLDVIQMGVLQGRQNPWMESYESHQTLRQPQTVRY